MANPKILESAIAVDEIVKKAFIGKARGTTLPEAETVKVNNYRLHLSYGPECLIDGRIVAVRFVDYCIENGKDYHIARPDLDNDDAFSLDNFAKIPEDALNKKAMPGNILDYSEGKLQMLSGDEVVQYFLEGILPKTAFVSFRSPRIRQDDHEFHQRFVDSLSR